MRILLPAAAILLAALPFVLPTFALTLATEALILGLFAMSLDLMVGYARLISFGHAAAYGLGAYACGNFLLHFAMPLPTFVTSVLPAGVPFPQPNPETGLVRPARVYEDAIRLEGNICRRIAPPNSPPPDLAHPDPEPVKGANGRRRR